MPRWNVFFLRGGGEECGLITVLAIWKLVITTMLVDKGFWTLYKMWNIFLIKTNPDKGKLCNNGIKTMTRTTSHVLMATFFTWKVNRLIETPSKGEHSDPWLTRNSDRHCNWFFLIGHALSCKRERLNVDQIKVGARAPAYTHNTTDKGTHTQHNR